MKKIYILGLMAAMFASCKPTLEPVKPSIGQGADFSSYVAVGDAWTAGFADAALYRSGQINSYPNILAEQFKTLGGGAFKQPLVPGEFGFPGAKWVLTTRKGMCDSSASLMPMAFTGALDTSGSTTNIFAAEGPFNNMGIPMIRAIDFVTAGYGTANTFARRMFAAPTLARPVDEIANAKPTFFSIWIGANDVLGYAMAGGGKSTVSTQQITNDYWFSAAYDSVVRAMRKNGAQGVLINIPDITSLPYFTTIQPKGLKLSKIDANLLNNAYNALNGLIRFEEGDNYFIIEDSSASAPANKFRHIKDGEMLLLSIPMDSLKCAGWGTRKPIPARYVLTADEVSNIQHWIDVFNGTIYGYAKRESLGLVDMYTYMKSWEKGIVYNGAGYRTSYINGGAFSLDGFSLTPRGAALVANRVLQTINEKYGATIPMVDVNSYKGIQFP